MKLSCAGENIKYKNIKKGSSLFELLVYIAIGLVLVSLGSLWVQHAYIPFSRSAQKIALLSCVSSGLSVLKRDLYRAPSNKTSWKKIAEHELIWTEPNSSAGQDSGLVTIGWVYRVMQPDSGAKNNKRAGELIRIEGSYDPGNGTWTQAITSIVAQHIEQFSFGVGYAHNTELEPGITSIAIEYRVAETNHTQLFALRDRVLARGQAHE